MEQDSYKHNLGFTAQPDSHVLPLNATEMTLQEQFAASHIHPDPSAIKYEPKTGGFWSSYIPAFVRRETIIGNMITQPSGTGGRVDPAFDVFTRIGYSGPVDLARVSHDLGVTLASAKFLVSAGSFDEYLRRSTIVQQEQEDRQTVASGTFWEGLAAGIITMPLDPIAYIPIAGAAVKGFKVGKLAAVAANTPAAKGFRAALGAGFKSGAQVGATSIAATEVGLQMLQTERSVEESMMNMAAGTIFSGLFVGTMRGVGHEWNMAKKIITEDLKLHGVQEHPAVKVADTKPVVELFDESGNKLDASQVIPHTKAAIKKQFNGSLAAEIRKNDPSDPFDGSVQKLPDDGPDEAVDVSPEAYKKSKDDLDAARAKVDASTAALNENPGDLALSTAREADGLKLQSAKDAHQKLEIARATKEATLKQMNDLVKEIDRLEAEAEAAFDLAKDGTPESATAYDKVKAQLDEARAKYDSLNQKAVADGGKPVGIAKPDNFSDVTFGPIDPKTQKPRVNPDGTHDYPAAVARDGKIYVDRGKILGMFDQKPWTKPKVEGVDPLPADAFKTPEEWLRFVVGHERAHLKNKRLAPETTGAYENRINKIALQEMSSKPARPVAASKGPTDAQRWAWAYEDVRRLTPEQKLAAASVMAKEGNPTAMAYLAVHGSDGSLPVAKAANVVTVQRYDLTANMDFTIGGYGYRTTAMNTIVPDGRLPAGATEMVPLDFRNTIVIDDGSLNYRPSRLYRIAAETDIDAQKQYSALGSAGVGRWLAKMVSPIIRISESKSLVARDIINKLVVTPSHSAAAQAGIASHTPAAVSSQRLFHLHTTVGDELVDIRLSLKQPVGEAQFNDLVSRFLLDADSPDGARAFSADGLAPEVVSAVEKAATVVEEKFFKVYDAEMAKVFPDYKGRSKYFPVQVIREKVDTDDFIRELTEVFVGQNANPEDAARSALWVQNKWLNLTTDSSLVNDAIVSSDFFHKWDTQFDSLKLTPEVKAEVWTVVNAARSAPSDKFVSRAALGDELLTSLTKSGIENPEIVVKDMLNDIYQNRSIFQSDDMETRGFMRTRGLNVPAGFRAKYQDMNLPEIMRRYAKRAAPDIEITRAFGDPLMNGALKVLREDYGKLIENATTVKERAKLVKERDYAIDRISKIRDDIRGVLNVPSDPNHWYHTANPVMRSLNYLAYSGNFALSNMADAGQATVMTGFKRHFWDGWLKYALDPELRKISKAEARSIGEGMDGELARSIAGLEDVTHGVGTRGPVQKGLEKATGFASMINLMSPMQDVIQRVNYTSQSNWFLRNVQTIAEGGKLGKTDQLWMAKLGVTDDAAKRIYAESGNWINRRGTMVANLDGWSDPATAKMYRDYMKHASKFNRILADVGDKPLFYSTQMGRTMGQFKGFLFASASKIFLMRLQQRDARVLASMVVQVGLGAMAFNLKNIAAGRPVSDDPEELVRAGVEQSGFASFFYDGTRVLEQVTRNGVGFNPTARSRESQQFSPAEAAGAVFGPSVSYIGDALSVASEFPDALKRGYVSRQAVQDGRALIPVNQNLFLKQLIDAGVDKAVPKKGY